MERLGPRRRSLRTVAWLLLGFGPLLLVYLCLWWKLDLFQHHARLWATRSIYSAEARRATPAGLLLLLAPCLLLMPLRRYLLLLLLDLVATFLVLADTLYYRHFGDVGSISDLSSAWQLAAVPHTVSSLFRREDLHALLDPVLMLFALPFLLRPLRAAPPTLRLPWLWRRPAALGLAAALAGAYLLIPTCRSIREDGDSRYLRSFYSLVIVEKLGLLNYHLYDAGRHLYYDVLLRGRVSGKERERVRRFLEARRERAAPPGELFGAARGKNLILVIVESLQGFPLGLRIGGKEVAPNLSALARRSLYFDRFYDQTWHGSTSDGEFASLQSLHPLSHGAVASIYPDNRYRGLPAVLRERGYATLSAVAYNGQIWNMRRMHPALGFERSFFAPDYDMVEAVNLGLLDDHFFQQTLPRLERQRRPFMAYLLTLTTHHPYYLPPRYKVLDLGELQGTYLGNYLHCVHYLDRAVGRLVEGLQRDGLWDESVFVLYGDHKANLMKWPEDLYRLLGISGRDELENWQLKNRLPLLVHLPGDAHAGVRPEIGGHLDVAPTVLGLLGVADHGMVSLGRDLLRPVAAEAPLVVFRDGSFSDGQVLCMSPGGTLRQAACYRMNDGAAVAPGALSARFGEARERLEISDLILQGNLIPAAR